MCRPGLHLSHFKEAPLIMSQIVLASYHILTLELGLPACRLASICLAVMLQRSQASERQRALR